MSRKINLQKIKLSSTLKEYTDVYEAIDDILDYEVLEDSLIKNGKIEDIPGQNTGVGSLSLLQRIFPAQESNRVTCIAGGFFTNWAIRDACKV